ncbi:nitrite reductase small subunit NirD [Paenibacillus alvei]|uniref:Nitrite reductase small subunit NirD n=1 Tax=Paenibacillus alvei TaxID=44250 RepID=A0AAP7DJS4_PAEAL|nr:nitrite reductase small subunit NirD [Paenibacillus alvei]MBG9733884.1 nitrite reductase [Paenibacillus alvei]MBG9746484.1 nitrite reductase [Paenibacillus alvei]MCY9582561.1 nitrite reductase small subunit NirD [Paenibacillus alvei]MCY9587868.1 nitrite reductase small subunit NirD [Paenibacillus alvei]NEZ42311.1 nitrite reductase small subunit NirD [Paenibacillus alvei]
MSVTKGLVKVIKLEELKPQIGKEVQVLDQTIAIFRLTNDEVRAVSNRCPHKNGPLAEGIVSGEFVFCPLHDWKISLTTGEVQKPDNGCITTYETAVIDGYVYIGEPIQHEKHDPSR